MVAAVEKRKRLGVLAVATPENGGIFQYTISMLDALQRIDAWDTTVYVNGDVNLYTSVHKDLPFPIRGVEASKRNWPLILLSYFTGRTIKDPFGDEDLVIAPVYSPILLVTKKPFVFTLHDLQQHYFPQNFSLTQRLWRKVIYSTLATKASRIICESSCVKTDISNFYSIDPEKIEIIASPPLHLRCHPCSSEELKSVRTRYDLPRKYFFYPAQFWPHKNHRNLIVAFKDVSAEFPDVALLFTGHKQLDYKKIFGQISELGLSNVVKHVGYIDTADMAAFYQNALALIMPSLFESISIPIYEAFQNEVPVCASNVVSLPEQVGDAGLLFNPTSPAEIAASMRTIITSNEIRQSLIQKGKLRLSTLTAENYAKKIEALIDRAI